MQLQTWKRRRGGTIGDNHFDLDQRKFLHLHKWCRVMRARKGTNVIMQAQTLGTGTDDARRDHIKANINHVYPCKGTAMARQVRMAKSKSPLGQLNNSGKCTRDRDEAAEMLENACKSAALRKARRICQQMPVTTR